MRMRSNALRQWGDLCIMGWPSHRLNSTLARFIHAFLHRLHEEARLLQSGQKKRPSIVFVIVGIASIIWLFVRSGQKPSRLAYPCQKAAAANTAVLLGWVAALLVGTAYSRKLGPRGRLIYRIGVLAGVIMLALGGLTSWLSRIGSASSCPRPSARGRRGWRGCRTAGPPRVGAPISTRG